MVHVMNKENSVFQHFLAEIRSERIQSDRLRFRRNLERMGELFAYELSKTFTYEEEEVQTPLGETTVPLMQQQPVVSTILRAGLPLHNGLLNYFDHADSAFISAYRKPLKNDPEEFEIKVEYMAVPNLDGKELIIADPMLASGSSIVLVYKALLEMGKPKQVHIVSCIASDEGLSKVKRNLPDNTSFWLGAVDNELTAQAYIVPGLGDAGDLAFGPKEDLDEN